MSRSVEARVPFLDHRLAEFAARLPVAWKVSGNRKKRVLKKSQSRRLPAHVLAGPKRGFNAPVSGWMAGAFGTVAKDLVLSGVLSPWIDARSVESLWHAHNTRQRDNGLRLFGLLCLAQWVDRHSITA